VSGAQRQITVQVPNTTSISGEWGLLLPFLACPVLILVAASIRWQEEETKRNFFSGWFNHTFFYFLLQQCGGLGFNWHTCLPACLPLLLSAFLSSFVKKFIL
jgi:hypothetical protein